MKFLVLALALLVSACSTAPSDQKSGWFFGLFPPLEWPSRHWDGLDFQNSMIEESSVKKASLNLRQSMFAQGVAVSPEELIENLKGAKIIRRVYNPEFGYFWDRHVSQETVIELDQNFYTLSYADQTVVADLLSRAFLADHYTLKDAATGRVVGYITPTEGFHLF